ncbi:hypothetical protein F443_14951 [Phytophthora nicotianae P1569]|uniref:Uncharacterized protein n=1 Tax=Phytophthora nicotianae P1569 TaxID=1317065 RepID=V9ELU3_PHYNI|nr:hypothetical protein F443_14951 [Phytophthora nicotianae P1569]
MMQMWFCLINRHTLYVCSGMVCLKMVGLWILLQNHANVGLTLNSRCVYTSLKRLKY